VHTQTEALQ